MTLSFPDDKGSLQVLLGDLNTGTAWTLAPDQIEKHRPMFADEYDAAPKAIADKIAAAAAKGGK